MAKTKRPGLAVLLVTGHPELGEQPDQVRVGAFVVDDEPAVDPQGAVRSRHRVRVRVTADPAVRLEECDRVGAGQDVRGGQPRDA